MDEVVEEVGVANVVQSITDNASNYVLAGKLLEKKRNHLLNPMCCTLHKPHARGYWPIRMGQEDYRACQKNNKMYLQSLMDFEPDEETHRAQGYY